METKTTGAPGVSAADLRALRSASTISFSYMNGRHQITATKDRLRTADGFDASVVIPCNGEAISYTGWSFPFGSTDTNYTVCSDVITDPDQNDVWQTAMRFMKPGDVLSLVWTASGNGYTSGAGLCMDSLHLVIERKRDKVERYTFLMAVRVCEDNTAHMMRRNVW